MKSSEKLSKHRVHNAESGEISRPTTAKIEPFEWIYRKESS